MTRTCLIFASMVALSGCSSSGERASPASAPTPATPNGATAPALSRATAPGTLRAPVEVKVTGPDHVDGAHDVTLRVSIDRSTRDPLDLRVSLPAGANLVSGAAVERIDETSGHIERTLIIHLANGVPAEDVHLSVDTGGTDYGAHANAAYRFGRAEPTLSQPPRTGNQVKVQGKTLGTPIPLK